LRAKIFARGIQVNADDRADHPRALNHIRSRCRRGQNDNIRAGLHLCSLITAPMPVVTPQPMWQTLSNGILADLRYCNLGKRFV
jgi:hypothetical protein